MACRTNPSLDCEPRVDSIEQALGRALGHPRRTLSPVRQSGAAEPSPERLLSGPLLAQLKASIERLSAAGGRLGATPEGYPLWVSLIIRGVSALLPWYTRSLHAYAKEVSAVAELTVALLEDAERRAKDGAR